MATAEPTSVKDEEGTSKKSRAQKRRDKKEAKAVRIDNLIADMDMALSHGDVEMEQLMLILSPQGLKTFDINPSKWNILESVGSEIMNSRRWRLSVLVPVSSAECSERRGCECETTEKEVC